VVEAGATNVTSSAGTPHAHRLDAAVVCHCPGRVRDYDVTDMGGRCRARGDGRVDAPAAAPAETAGTMRSFSAWLEDKLAEEPKESTASTAQKLFPYANGLIVALVLTVTTNLHVRPVWPFLILVTLSVVASYFVYGRIGPWWALVLAYVGGVLLLTLIG
jgi:hypothetical protein